MALSIGVRLSARENRRPAKSLSCLQRLFSLSHGSIGRDEKVFLVLIVGTYTAALSYLSLLRHWSFKSTFYDLGIFEHEFWLRRSSGLPGLQNLVFGGHISPTLYIFLPFYTIWPKTETLLILQSLVLGLSSVPLFFIAKETLSSWKLSVVCSLVVLLYAPVHWVNLTDFHAQSLIPLFFLLSYFSVFSCLPLSLLNLHQ